MMKAKDVSVATALVLQGFMRANEDTKEALAEGIAAIRQEADDWSENLERPDDGSALEPHQLTTAVREVIPMSIVDGGPPINRTPYNLVSAAIALLGEAVDLSGPEIVLADFQKRSTELSVDKRPAPAATASRGGSRRVLIPDNEHGVPEGYHDPVELLRLYKGQPAIVQFIADMLE